MVYRRTNNDGSEALSVDDGEYTYSDGTKSKTNPHIIGMYGEKGVSVTSTTALFYLSTSNTQVTGGTWVTTVQTEPLVHIYGRN